MDAISDIIEKLSLPVLRDFLSENARDYVQYLDSMEKELKKVQVFMKTTNFRAHPGYMQLALVEGVRLTVRKVANFMRTIISNKKLSSYNTDNLVKEMKETIDFVVGIVVFCNSMKQTETKNEMEDQDTDAVVKDIETLLHDASHSSNGVNCTMQNVSSEAILLAKACPALADLKKSSEKKEFLVKLSRELDNLPQQICKACDGQPLALKLIGGLLSLKQTTYDTWHGLYDGLCKIKGKDNHFNSSAKEPDNYATDSSHMMPIFTYCYEDLPYFLKPCFLYLACYPIDYEIPARSLIEIWIAEGFVIPEKGETREETADKYLEQLVQRSLVHVVKRSSFGTIKYCQVPRPLHHFAVQQSNMDGFLVTNPDMEAMESLFRSAIHGDNEEQYTEVENNHIHSFLAFDFDRNVLSSAVFLKVLESRKSAVPVAALSDMMDLRYLRLRETTTTISELPDIGNFKNLQTLDVRETHIETLPESLWSIKSLRHVYVMPSAKIEGPPADSKIEDLQILKTVQVPKSWESNTPQFLINLRKLALSNPNDLNWISVSNLLNILGKLLSLGIKGKTIPSEFADTRAFPNLETVKSIRLEGTWNCRKLFIDNVKFPPHLTKLTLANSGLKEDPMPTLEKLQSLKYLSLQEGAYSGEKMVCSANGFPQLQTLQLQKLEKLVSWMVEGGAMPQISKLRVILCPRNLQIPDHLLNRITDKVIN